MTRRRQIGPARLHREHAAVAGHSDPVRPQVEQRAVRPRELGGVDRRVEHERAPARGLEERSAARESELLSRRSGQERRRVRQQQTRPAELVEEVHAAQALPQRELPDGTVEDDPVVLDLQPVLAVRALDTSVYEPLAGWALRTGRTGRTLRAGRALDRKSTRLNSS